ncbi:uncharacterized protein [Eurosta solidaginis]|uniref:uncharacterized protein n=1 Tax=Eurosta solidaginis TaxID=178769 RepID=UPI0035306273
MDSSQRTEVSLEYMRCCRSCLSVASQDELNDYIDLMESFTLSQSDVTSTMLEAFNKYAQLQIKPDDFDVKGYPPCHYLCGRCYQDLKQSHQFKNRAQLNNQILMGNYKIAQLYTAAEELNAESKNMHTQIHQDYFKDSGCSIAVKEDGNEDAEVEFISKEFEYEESNANIVDDPVDISDTDNYDLEIAKEKLTKLVVESLNQHKTGQYTSQKQLHLSESVGGIVCIEQEDSIANDENGLTKGVAGYDDNLPDDPSIGGTRKTCYDFKCEFFTSIFEFRRDLLHHYELDHIPKVFSRLVITVTGDTQLTAYFYEPPLKRERIDEDNHDNNM